MTLQICPGVDRERGIVDRRPVGNHHQDAPLLWPGEQAVVRPGERLAVNILLKQAFAHHQPEIAPRTPPRCIGRLVDYVTEVVEPPRDRRLERIQALLSRMPALPGGGGEGEGLAL